MTGHLTYRRQSNPVRHFLHDVSGRCRGRRADVRAEVTVCNDGSDHVQGRIGDLEHCKRFVEVARFLHLGHETKEGYMGN